MARLSTPCGCVGRCRSSPYPEGGPDHEGHWSVRFGNRGIVTLNGRRVEEDCMELSEGDSGFVLFYGDAICALTQAPVLRRVVGAVTFRLEGR